MKQIVCPCCGARIEADMNGRDSVFCTYCGCQISLYDHRSEYTINKNINVNKDIRVDKAIQHRYTDDAEILKEHNRAREERAIWKVLAVLMVVLIGFGAIMAGIEAIEERQAQKEGKISVGSSSSSLIKQDYETVVANLEAAGFTNIEVIDLNDAGLAFWNDGKVESISIGGDTSFDSSDYFYPDAKVVITHH